MSELRADTPRVVAIMGPTGAGKSDLAMALARELDVEIISVDSAQVYRGMDIGTAKPSPLEREQVPHHLLDIREPEEGYCAGEFRRDALALITAIHSRGRLPLLVGGTMLYFKTLFQGIAVLPPADAALRKSLDARAASEGWPALHAELAAVDPVAAARIHPNDAQRIQRALEVGKVAGRSLTDLFAAQAQAVAEPPAFECLAWALVPESRPLLHERLEKRLAQMLTTGFIDEVRALRLRKTLSADSPALRAVGYRQLLAFCDGEVDLPSAKLQALYATRQLAKRQLTWLRAAALQPPGAGLQKIDPFDAAARERLRVATISWSQCRN